MNIYEPFEKLETLLNEHPIALELKELGVEEKQLNSIRYWRRGKFDPLDEAPVTWSGQLQPQAIPLARVYCALRGILDGSLISAEDRETAHRIVAIYGIHPIIYAAEKHSGAQSDRAKKKRNSIAADGTTINDLIRRLVCNPELSGLSAKDLWPHLYAALDEIGAAPEEISSPRDAKTSAWQYVTYNGRSRRMTFDTFQNIVSKLKNSR